MRGGRESSVCAASAPSAPPAPPLTLRLCPFFHPCSEEAKSTTWLHPVTGEAVVTGHRRQSTGNAEPDRAERSWAPSRGGGRARAARLPASCPKPPSSGGGEVGRRLAGAAAGRGATGALPPEFSRVSGRLSSPQPFITTWRRRPLLRPLPYPNWNPLPYALGVADSPLAGNLESRVFPPAITPKSSYSPSPKPPPLFEPLRSPFPLLSRQPGTLPLVRLANVFTSSPSSRESCLLLCSFLLLGRIGG